MLVVLRVGVKFVKSGSRYVGILPHFWFTTGPPFMVLNLLHLRVQPAPAFARFLASQLRKQLSTMPVAFGITCPDCDG